jgi:hypothetical protein
LRYCNFGPLIELWRFLFAVIVHFTVMLRSHGSVERSSRPPKTAYVGPLWLALSETAVDPPPALQQDLSARGDR